MIFQEVYDTALSKIKSVCVNVSNYSRLDSAFKSGYTYSQTEVSVRLNVSIINPISQVSTTTVDNEFRSWMQTCGVTNYLNDEVNASGLMNFYLALSSFCTARVKTAAGQMTSNKQVVYYNNGQPIAIQQIQNGENIMYATNTEIVASTIGTIISRNTKAYVVNYSYTMTAI